MIMPCMNAASAGAMGGSVAFVEEGSVLVGFPGAPGCTTTGAAASLCCACGFAAAAGSADALDGINHANANARAAKEKLRASRRRYPFDCVCGVSDNPMLG